MQPPKRTVIICSSQRSGSTFFAEAIGSSGNCGMPKEYWIPPLLAPLSFERGNAPQDVDLELLRYTSQLNQTPNGVYAIKLMHDTLEQLLHKLSQKGIEFSTPIEFLESILPNPTYIHVIRRKKLAQATSFTKAEQTGVWGNETPRDDIALFDYSAIAYNRRQLNRQNEGWLKVFEDSQITPITVFYEDFVRDYHGTLDHVFAALNLENNAASPRKNPMKQSRTSLNSEWAERFREMESSLEDFQHKEPIAEAHRITSIEPLNVPDKLVTETTHTIDVKITNHSTIDWQGKGGRDGINWLRLEAGWHPLNQTFSKPSRAIVPTPLMADIKQSKTLLLTTKLIAPPTPSQYELRWQLRETNNETDFQYTPASQHLQTVTITPTENHQKAYEYFGDALQPFLGTVKFHSVFGYIDDSLFPWIHHGKLGWLYTAGDGWKKDDYHFHLNKLGWCWTNAEKFPTFKANESEEPRWYEFDLSQTHQVFYRIKDSEEAWTLFEPRPDSVDAASEDENWLDSSQDILLYSMRHFFPLLQPVLDKLTPDSICEIGVESGQFTKLLIDYAQKRGARYLGIDPAIQDKAILELRSETIQFVEKTSLDALPGLEAQSVYFIDGDHNYYTVYNELRHIAQQMSEPRPPFIVFHDTHWPWARRDQYYAPDTIPLSEKHTSTAEAGPIPNSNQLSAQGYCGKRSKYYFEAAEQEGGAKNGVLTAIEDAQKDFFAAPWTRLDIPVIFGLSILYCPGTLSEEVSQELVNLKNGVSQLRPLLETLEENRNTQALAFINLCEQYKTLKKHSEDQKTSYKELQETFRALRSRYRELDAAFQTLKEEKKNWESGKST